MTLFQETAMRASEFSANHIAARATSGGRLDIRYDPSPNAIVFIEDDWSADVRGATVRNTTRELWLSLMFRRLPRRFGAFACWAEACGLCLLAVYFGRW